MVVATGAAPRTAADRVVRERVIIRLADPAGARASLLASVTGAPLTLGARHERVVEGLQAIHSQSVLAAAPVLAAARAAGGLREVDRLWIVNAIVAEVDPAWIARIEADPAVLAVIPDRHVIPAAGGIAAGTRSGHRISPTATVPVNELVRIRAPEVWAQGNTGQGAVVANVDTGVNGEDDTMQDRWRGLFAGSDATWFAPSALTVFPVDDDQFLSNGHGTETMGIMTGGEATFGVAYDATWISGDLFEDGEGLVSTALKIFEWLTDPDEDPATFSDVPDVVNNSWVISVAGQQVCDNVFDDAMDAVEAAGAIVVWSAGNFGLRGVTAPANRAVSNVNAFAVGGVDAQNVPVDDSGRGPSACGGGNVIKPEVVAPGQDVTSRNRFNQTVSGLTGTSFAAPMAAGILALMRSKNPAITPEEAKTILLETAQDLGAPGEDNNTGNGLVDAAAALARVNRPSQPLARLVGFRPQVAGAGKIAPAGIEEALILVPGASASLVPVLSNHGPALPATTATLTSPTPGVSIVQPAIPLEPAETGEIFGAAPGAAFGIALAPTVAAGSDIELTLSISGASIGPFTLILKAGQPIAGQFATHDAGLVRLSVTNFGGLGYFTGRAPSNFVLEGDGFRFPPSSPNWLFHGSFLAGVAPDRLSDDIPYGTDLGQSTSDWTPLPGFPLVMDQASGAQRIVAGYDDRHAVGPVGLRVRQESFAFDESASPFVILQYILTNTTRQTLGGLRLGLFTDWDLPDASGEPAETADWVPALRLGYVEGTVAGQPALGAVWLDDVPLSRVSFAVVGKDAVAGDLVPAQAPLDGEFTDEEKWALLTSGQTDTSEQNPQDLYLIIGVGPLALAAGASDTVAVALVAGADLSALRSAAEKARADYFQRILGQAPPPPPEPVEELALLQNFPNPFQASSQSTTIEFAVPEAEGGSLALEVYDMLGRQVRTLVREESFLGTGAVSWDGRDDRGRVVPAGVYIIRLSATGRQETIRVLVLP